MAVWRNEGRSTQFWHAYSVFQYCESASQVVITISYLLLLKIFWQLGTKVEPRNSYVSVPEEIRLSEPELEEFDEDSETMALIWNQLVRKTQEADHLRLTGSVTSNKTGIGKKPASSLQV
jgi:hypothetical protein